MSNPTDTNQASEGDTREQTRRSVARLISIQRGDDTWSDDDYITAGNILIVFSRYIRTEKLKLLAEVRDQQIPVIALKAKKPHDEVQIQAVPIESLNKLEAEL